MASSSDATGGATEHASGRVWEGVLAFSNIGLAGNALRGKRWPRVHEKRLSKLVSDLFSAAPERGGRVLCGTLLNEVGNLSELVDELGREKFNRALTASLRQSCSEEPQIYWSSG